MHVVKVVLLSDLGSPSEIANVLAEELPELLGERVDKGVVWEVMTAEEAPRGQDGAELLDAARKRMLNEDWDVAICLTDLPLQAHGRPVVIDASTADGVGVVSLPGLGQAQPRHRAREAVVALVGHLIEPGDRPGAARETATESARALPTGSPAPAPGQAGPGVRLLSPRARGNLRLLIGMVRANRPWRLFLGLPRALSATVAAAAIAMVNVTGWQLGDTFGIGRLCLLIVGVLTVMVSWLILAHGLWERSPAVASGDQVRLFNAVTVLRLAFGGLCLFVVVFAAGLLAAELFIDGDFLGAKLGHSVGLADYVRLAWVVASAGVLGGAIGSAWEGHQAVRDAAYGRRDGVGDRGDAGARSRRDS